MIKTPNMNVLAALNTLSANNDFKTVIGWLEESLDETDIQNRHKSSEELYRGQGVAICIADFLARTADASRALKKMRESR